MPRKQVTPALQSWAEVDERLAILCMIESDVRAIESEMNAELTRIRELYQGRLDALREERAINEMVVQQFCKEHRGDWGKRKSSGLTHGTVSFRDSPPACVLAGRKWKWGAVIEALKASLNKALRGCVRVKESVNKEAVLAAVAAEHVTAQELRAHGLRIKERETFGIDLKFEEAAESPEAAL